MTRDNTITFSVDMAAIVKEKEQDTMDWQVEFDEIGTLEVSRDGDTCYDGKRIDQMIREKLGLGEGSRVKIELEYKVRYVSNPSRDVVPG